MEVTPEQLLTEAGLMALELRLKDQKIAALEAANADLARQVEELTHTDGRAR